MTMTNDWDLCLRCPHDYNCELCDLYKGSKEKEEEELAQSQLDALTYYNYGGYGHLYDCYAKKDGVSVVYQACCHQDWLDVTLPDGKTVSLFLASSGPIVPPEVDVFIRLTTNEPSVPYVPDHLKQFLPDREEAEYLVSWEITDGKIDNSGLVDFCLNMIRAGKTIGFGCVGGHGRTGWLAAKLIVALTGVSGDQAVAALRENYCHKAVETQAQADDLGLVEQEPYYLSRSYSVTTTVPKGQKNKEKKT
jgi:hypothetical protein